MKTKLPVASLSRIMLLLSLSLAALLGLAGCNDKANEEAGEPSVTKPAPATTPPRSRPKIIAFGDSLTAGYGLAAPESYPALLQERLEADGYNYEVVNAGVSGDTSAGGLRRIDWALEGDVRFLVLELGANDILRGQPIAQMKENLGEIIKRAQAKGVQVLLAGMESPTSAGLDYRREVHEAFPELAREYNVPLIPFFLDKVAGLEALNQADGVHPNAAGTRIVAETVYQSLRPMLEQAKAQSTAAP